jgi:hypothetical protein
MTVKLEIFATIMTETLLAAAGESMSRLELVSPIGECYSKGLTLGSSDHLQGDLERKQGPLAVCWLLVVKTGFSYHGAKLLYQRISLPLVCRTSGHQALTVSSPSQGTQSPNGGATNPGAQDGCR